MKPITVAIIGIGRAGWGMQFGDRGSLTCDDTDIKLKYLAPGFIPTECCAIPETPPLTGSFGNTERLPWIRKTIMVEPQANCDTTTIWDHLFAAIREGKPFPITLEEAIEVVRVSEKAKSGTEFEKK